MAAETDSSALTALLGTLSTNIDTVEAALSPLLAQPLSTTTSRLPLLDKAKLYVHAAYAIESLLFSHLRLSGADTKSHAIMAELGRVRAYFEKIKTAETTDSAPAVRLDKAAANRFVRHALAGNEELPRRDELAERYGKGSRFEAAGKRMREADPHPEVEESRDENGGEGKTRRKKSRTSGQGAAEGTSRHRKKLSHAPKDAHQAFQSLLSRSAKPSKD